MIVVIEGTMADVCAASRGISHNAITGTIAAWTLRYCPFVFCGSQQEAANFAFRFLAAQMRDAERMAKAISPPALDGFLRWRLPASPLAERCKMAAWSSGVSFMKCTRFLFTRDKTATLTGRGRFAACVRLSGLDFSTRTGRKSRRAVCRGGPLPLGSPMALCGWVSRSSKPSFQGGPRAFIGHYSVTGGDPKRPN
jgi:hypothetical protein